MPAAGRKHFHEAIAAYQKSLELDSEHFEPHANLGEIYLKQARYDEALTALFSGERF
jgi:cytochrome c-type biogenesis protein CcmH/NrfG